jgi:hypothetical protein
MEGSVEESKIFAIAVFSIVIVACILQAVYSRRLGRGIVRRLAASPRSVQEFYARTTFGRPYDGVFWTRARRWLSIAIGAIFLAALISVIAGK